jgi:hypothetical protein
MLNYLKMFVMQILPSVAATIIGAYIVNHYIVPKPGSESPAAAVSSAQSKAGVKADARNSPAKPGETTGDVANLPEAGVKAKGISEKALLERNAAAEKAVVEKPAAEKAAEKASDNTAAKPTETASVPAEPRRHQPVREKTETREKPEKTAVRVIPLTPAQPATPAPIVAAPASAPSVEAAPDERRDANDLARAAIDRLRGGDSTPRTQSAARAPEAPRNPETPRVPETPSPLAAQAVRPLPPPIMVSTPPADAVDSPASQPRPPYAANATRGDDPLRPTPPAEIPTARPPLDLRAEMAPPREKEKTSVADDMLSAAKSVFHSVLPK